MSDLRVCIKGDPLIRARGRVLRMTKKFFDHQESLDASLEASGRLQRCGVRGVESQNQWTRNGKRILDLSEFLSGVVKSCGKIFQTRVR